MKSCCALIILLAVANCGTQGYRVRRQAGDNQDETLDDRYGWERPNRFPNQEFQNQGFQNQGIQNQAFPNQEFQNQAFPNQEFQNQRFPNQGGQNQGLPNQGQNTNQGQNINQGQLTSQAQSVQRCLSRCVPTPEFNPVCGSDGVTYENPSRLFCSQQCGVNVNLVRMSQCPRTTPSPLASTPPAVNPAAPGSTQSPAIENCMRTCPVTPEYNPVCGSDNVTYDNPGKLYCAQRCGANVNLFRSSRCPAAAAAAAT